MRMGDVQAQWAHARAYLIQFCFSLLFNDIEISPFQLQIIAIYNCIWLDDRVCKTNRLYRTHAHQYARYAMCADETEYNALSRACAVACGPIGKGQRSHSAPN